MHGSTQSLGVINTLETAMLIGHVRTKRYSGGDQEVTSRLDAIASAATELFAADSNWLWVTVESEGSNKAIQIANEANCPVINIPHKERRGLYPLFKQAGLDLPDGWIVSRDKQKGLFSSGYLEIRGYLYRQVDFSYFVEEVGVKILGWDDELSLTCSLQG